MPRNLRDLFQVRISLNDVDPPVWRRFLLSSSTDLSELHQIIQIVMGWSNSHMHQFTAGHRQFGIPDEEFGDSTTPERGVRIGALLKNENQRITYEYDFGDSWVHELLLEKILPFKPEDAGPCCIDGRRACPPEDVGGPWGYLEFLEAYSDSGHPDHQEKLNWIEEPFDPERFDLDQVNLALKNLRRRAV